MTAEELRNLGACGAGAALGFNTDKGCADLLEAAESIWLLSPSLKIPGTQDINAAYIESLQMAGKLVVIKGISSFAETGNDDAVETLEDDTMIETNKGKYKYTATFAGKGLYYNRALNSIGGFGGWRAAIVDKKGDVFMTHNDENEDYGFTLGMIKANKLVPASNTAGTKAGLDFQMLNRYELDEFYTRWDNSKLPFDPRLISPVTQVYLSLVNAPADTDTVVTVKAVAERGRQLPISGALFSQWANTVGGAANNPTAGDDSVTEGTYPLTLTSALVSGGEGTIRLYDNANNSPVIKVAGDGLYKSNIVPYVVTA